MSFSAKYQSNLMLCLFKHLFIVLFLLPFSLSAQIKEEDKNAIIEKRVEYLIEDAEESDADYTTIFDNLSYYFDHPLNLNRAKLDELESLGLLTSIQINNLLVHIDKNGKLMTLEELQTIDGFDLEEKCLSELESSMDSGGVMVNQSRFKKKRRREKFRRRY